MMQVHFEYGDLSLISHIRKSNTFFIQSTTNGSLNMNNEQFQFDFLFSFLVVLRSWVQKWNQDKQLTPTQISIVNGQAQVHISWMAWMIVRTKPRTISINFETIERT